MIAVCTPVTVVPRSSATWAMDTFITALSRVIRNWPEARVNRTIPAAAAACSARFGDEEVSGVLRSESSRDLVNEFSPRGRTSTTRTLATTGTARIAPRMPAT